MVERTKPRVFVKVAHQSPARHVHRDHIRPGGFVNRVEYVEIVAAWSGGEGGQGVIVGEGIGDAGHRSSPGVDADHDQIVLRGCGSKRLAQQGRAAAGCRSALNKFDGGGGARAGAAISGPLVITG